LRVRKRMRHGLSVGGTYTYSKSIDDASSIGGGATVVAQNDLDISAERSLSSFDQRHRFVADYSYELPFGKDKKWLTASGPAQRIFSGFAFSGNVMLASGFPFSPRYFGRATDLSRGTTGSARPDLVPGQSIVVQHRGLRLARRSVWHRRAQRDYRSWHGVNGHGRFKKHSTQGNARHGAAALSHQCFQYGAFHFH
jgi:hypothetical protein